MVGEGVMEGTAESAGATDLEPSLTDALSDSYVYVCRWLGVHNTYDRKRRRFSVFLFKIVFYCTSHWLEGEENGHNGSEDGIWQTHPSLFP